MIDYTAFSYLTTEKYFNKHKKREGFEALPFLFEPDLSSKS